MKIKTITHKAAEYARRAADYSRRAVQFIGSLAVHIRTHAAFVTLVLSLVYIHLFVASLVLAAAGATLAAIVVCAIGLALLAVVLALAGSLRPGEVIRGWITSAVANAVPKAREPEPAPEPTPPPAPIIIREPVEVPLEDNKAFAKLAKENSDFMEELDALAPRLDENSQKLIQHVQLRLQEGMERCGVERIDEETVYDVVRHKSATGQRIAQGAPIQETVMPGLILGKKVLRRAKVK